MGAFSSVTKDLRNAKCQIALKDLSITAGNVCIGYVDLVINSPIACQQILIDLKGEAYTTVGYSSGTGKRKKRRTARQNLVLYTLRIVAAQYPSGIAPPGQYQIPFQFSVPKNAPASFVIPKFGRNGARITHSVAVGVQKNGHVYYVHSCPFQVLSPLNHQINSLMIADEKEVLLCCCISRGSISLAARTDKNAYTSNECATILYEVYNRSSRRVASINIELVCKIRYSARNHNHYSSRKIVQLKCGSIEPNSGFGSKTNPPSSPMQVQLQVPTVEFSSCQTPTISVSYFIRLQTMTGSFVSNPSVEIPVTLYQVANSNQGQMMVHAIAQSFQPDPDADGAIGMQIPIANAIPYNPNPNMQNEFEPADKSLTKPVPVDTTGDGIANAMGYDTSGDGKIDALDTNLDGKIDTVLETAKVKVSPVG
eukprot:g12624.t1